MVDNIEECLAIELRKIYDDDKFIEHILFFLEVEADKEKLLNFILEEKRDKKAVILMTSYLSIKSGTAQGEIIEDGGNI